MDRVIDGWRCEMKAPGTESDGGGGGPIVSRIRGS